MLMPSWLGYKTRGHLLSAGEVNNTVSVLSQGRPALFRLRVVGGQQALCTLCGENVKALAAMATRQLHSPH